MTKYTVTWLGGTGYGDEMEGVSAAFAKHLDDRFEFQYLRYPASFGHPLSYAESVIEGRRLLIDAIRATPNQVVLGGFSQGSGIAGDVAAEIAAGQHPDLEIAACALIADPSRPEGAGLPGLAPTGGYGIEGQRPIFGPVKFPVYHAAAPGDPICALPEGNPLRSIADLTEWYSLSSPDAAGRWAQDLVDRARSNRWQRWWSIENIRTWGGALGFARNYLPKPIGNGRHGEAYITEGFCRSLATAVNRGVR